MTPNENKKVQAKLTDCIHKPSVVPGTRTIKIEESPNVSETARAIEIIEIDTGNELASDGSSYQYGEIEHPDDHIG